MKISIKRGDHVTIEFVVKKDGAVLDITGYTAFITVKKKTTQTDDEAVISKTWTSHNDPTNGITQLNLENSDTQDIEPGVYMYDFQVTDTSGKPMSSETDLFIITSDITNRIT